MRTSHATPRGGVTPAKSDTRRAFLFAREQVAANGSAGRYFAARETRHWAPDRQRAAPPARDVGDSPAR
jgi:hypothetical protein